MSFYRVSILSVLSFLMMSCSSGFLKSSSSAHFELREYQQVKLNNGLNLILLRDHRIPRTSLSLLVKAGSRNEPPSKAGLNSLVARLLDEGTSTRSAIKIADDFGQIAADYGVDPSQDYTYISASSLSSQKVAMLNQFADVVLNPAFSEKEVRRLKQETLAGLKRMIDNPRATIEREFEERLFAPHPYQNQTIGKASDIEKIKRIDIIKHYLQYYRPNNAWLAVVGDFDEAYVTQVTTAFAAWEGRPQEAAQFPVATKQNELNTVVVSKADLQQAQIIMGQIGIQRTDPDYLALRAANVILGGAFASRLNQHIRDDLGLTYSINSYFDSRLDPGSFTISTFTRLDKVSSTVNETLKVVRDFKSEGVKPEEVAAAQALLKGQFPSALETADRTAFNLLLLRAYGVSDAYLNDFFKNIDRLSVATINEALRKHIDPEKFLIVVYADEKKLGDQLKDLPNVKVEPLKP